MKIVHISNSPTGGAGIAAFRLHKSLIDSGVDSSFVQHLPVDDAYRTMNTFRCTHYHPLSYRIFNKVGLLSRYNKYEIYSREINKYPKDYEIATLPYSYFPIENHPVVQEADIIHLHWVANFLNYPTFFAKINKPIVWTLHDMNPFQGIFHYEGDTQRYSQTPLGNIDRKVLVDKASVIGKRDDLTIITPSSWMKEKSQNSEVLGKFPHYTMPNLFNFDALPLLDKDAAKRTLNIDNGLSTILFVAQALYNKRKGMDILLQSLSELKGRKFNLITLGESNIEIENSEINHIHIDHTDDHNLINTLYTAADSTILPSIEDNLPNVMVESLINGTPVISFANGGMREHIETGVNGILIDSICHVKLTEAISDILDNKYIFDRIKIREYAETSFSEKNHIQSHIDLYKSILSQ